MNEAVRISYGARESEKHLVTGDSLVMVNQDGSLSIEIMDGKKGVRLRLSAEDARHHKDKLLSWGKSRS